VELVGKVGRARTELLPGGIVRVGDWELPAISTVAPVARDEQVRILEVRAGYVLVTPAEIEKFEPPS